jgi:hypothetical protein
MLPIGFRNRSSENVARISHLVKNSSVPIFTYATLPGIPSCQTKMVLGRDCGEDLALSEAHLREAKRRIASEDFLFFGLTEEPEASANLFLALHLPTPPPQPPLNVSVFPSPQRPFSFSSVRANKLHTEATHQALGDALGKEGWTDRFDQELYREAAAIFYRRCAENSVSTVHSSFEDLLAHPHRE